ncbi:MAG: hypothetical protein U0414_10990 [Polyangiaceae bacterium]
MIERLDAFAFEREKVLDKLDIKRAKAARALSMELGTVRRTLGCIPRDPSDDRTNEVIRQFRELRVRAAALMAGAPLETEAPMESGPMARVTPPPSSAEQATDDRDLDEITAARTPESLRTSPKRR